MEQFYDNEYGIPHGPKLPKEPEIPHESGISHERIFNSNENEKTLQRLVCGICLNLLWKPVSCSNCQSLFCNLCITKWLNEDNRTCPNRCIFVKMNTPPVVNQYLSDLEVKCKNESKGCKSIVGYDQLEKHEKECEFRDEFCKGCHQSFIYISLHNHEENCAYIKVVCRACKNEFSKLEIKNHDEFECLKDLNHRIITRCESLKQIVDLLLNVNSNLQKQNNDLKNSNAAQYYELNNHHIECVHSQNKAHDSLSTNQEYDLFSIDRKYLLICPNNHSMTYANDYISNNFNSSSSDLLCSACRSSETNISKWYCMTCDYKICQKCGPTLL